MGAETRTWRQRFADWWESRDGLATDQVSMARQVRDNKTEIAALKAQLAELEDWKAAHQAQADARTTDVFAMLAQAAQAAGTRIPDLEQTLPYGVYPFPRDRRAG